jgi:hypothetical protein
MQLKRALAVAGITGALITGGTAAVATPAAAATCSTSGKGTSTGTGWCASGVTWRVGIICSNGDEQWSAWYSYSKTARQTCTGSGKVTYVWIDIA